MLHEGGTVRRYGFVRPLSFLGRLKPFFSFWQRKKRMGSKKRSFGCGGNRKKRADRVVRPYMVRWKIEGCTDVLQLLPDPHPSASQTPSPEGKAIRCGGDGADRGVRPYGCGVGRKVVPYP